MTEKKSDGFISVELLILIVIIGLLAFTGFMAFVTASTSARDEQRMEDITAIQSALRIFFTENGYYPNNASSQVPAGIDNYLDRWPSPPAADGTCTEALNQYVYSQKANGEDFTLAFCLGRRTNGLSAGTHILNSKLIQ